MKVSLLTTCLLHPFATHAISPAILILRYSLLCYTLRGCLSISYTIDVNESHVPSNWGYKIASHRCAPVLNLLKLTVPFWMIDDHWMVDDACCWLLLPWMVAAHHKHPLSSPDTKPGNCAICSPDRIRPQDCGQERGIDTLSICFHSLSVKIRAVFSCFS